MENNEKKNHSLIDLMDASMSKIREMVDSNTIIGEPIQTPDGVTLIPVSRLSFGFGCGGGGATNWNRNVTSATVTFPRHCSLSGTCQPTLPFVACPD